MILMASFGQPVTPNTELMGFMGSLFQIITFSAAALFALALVVIVWLCFTESKKSEN